MEEQYVKSESAWIVDGTLRLKRLVIEKGGSIVPPEGKALALEINGDLCDPVPGTYEGDVVVHVMDAMPQWGEMTGPYRSGLFFGKEGLEPEKSALGDRFPAGQTDLKGLDLTIRGNFLNGVSCDGGRTVVEDSTLRFLGNGDDFRLTGTAVAAGGDAEVILRNCTIRSEGVAATTVAVGGDADVLVDSCTLEGKGIEDPGYYLENHHLTVVPWVLGLRGTVRASNLLERGTVTYYNTTASCNGWGVLSVDMTKDATHNLVNVQATIPAGGYNSGYCAYLLGGTTSTFLGCELDVPDYVFAVGGNDHHTVVGPSSQANLRYRREQLALLDREVGLENVPERPCVIRAGKFAGMWHHASTGEFEILPGTEIEAGICAFLIKSGDRLNPPLIRCDGVTVRSPMLLHLMESDDPGMGNYGRDKSWAPYFESVYAPEPDPEHDLTAVTEESVRAEFRNMTLTGDCFNTKWKKPQNMSLTFDNSSISGVISCGRHVHRAFSWGVAEDEAGNRVCTDAAGRPYVTEAVEDMLFGKMPVTYHFPKRDEDGRFVYAENREPLPMIGYAISEQNPELLGDVVVSASEPIGNGVIVTLKNSSVWTVTGEGYLTSLTIEAGSSLRGRLFVGGSEIPAEPGVYTGALRVLPA